MGLDWLVKTTRKDNVPEEWYEITCNESKEADTKLNDLWKKLKEKLGPKDEAMIGEFYGAIEDTHKIGERLKMMSKDKIEALNIPRFGIDEVATTWMLNYFDDVIKDPEHPQHKEWQTTNLDAFCAHEYGRPVPDAIKSKGFGKVTGMMLVGPDSFRGKILQSYEESETLEIFEDKTPDELADMAAIMKDIAKNAKKEGDKDKANDFQAAADWAKFWSSKGFGMHAWS